ncbi:MAG TPA: single-stranded DNA-binding protein [Catalimonadaceae bacterium]|nr:single-stranded DNA-binding protein [Catalimonadaceae bacterium]
MASYNKITLVGNVGNDPQIRIVGDNRKVVDLSIAINERARGNLPEKTEWYRVSFWDAKAEIAANYVRKGNPIYIEGRLSVSTYLDPNTNRDRYRLDVLGTELVLLSNKVDGEQGMPPSRTFENKQTTSAAVERPETPVLAPQSLAKTAEEDDLPF